MGFAASVAIVGIGYIWHLLRKFIQKWESGYFIHSQHIDIGEDALKRRSDSYAYKYPNGWFPVLFSADLPNESVKTINVFGETLTIFRGKNGEVGCIDGFCPHLGSSIGLTGNVCDNYVECGYHGWKFDTSGKCVDIPYMNTKQKKIPSNAHSKSYPVCEFYQFIMVYYDYKYYTDVNSSINNKKLVPKYLMPKYQLIDKNELYFVNSFDAGVFRMHIQEVTENGADYAHFNKIHKKIMFPFTMTPIPLLHKFWYANYQITTFIANENNNRVVGKSSDDEAKNDDDKKEEQAQPRLRSRLEELKERQVQYSTYSTHDMKKAVSRKEISKIDSWLFNDDWYVSGNKYNVHLCVNVEWYLFGNKMMNSNQYLLIEFAGPGMSVFRFRFPAYDNSEVVVFHGLVMESDMKLRVRVHWYASPKLPKYMVWFLVGGWLAEWTQDLLYWENKMFTKKPILVNGDGPVNKMRLWYKKFYYDESVYQQKKGLENRNGKKKKEENNKKEGVNSYDW